MGQRLIDNIWYTATIILGIFMFAAYLEGLLV